MKKSQMFEEAGTVGKKIPAPGGMDKSKAQTAAAPATAKSNRAPFQPKTGNKNIPKPGAMAKQKTNPGKSRSTKAPFSARTTKVDKPQVGKMVGKALPKGKSKAKMVKDTDNDMM